MKTAWLCFLGVRGPAPRALLDPLMALVTWNLSFMFSRKLQVESACFRYITDACVGVSVAVVLFAFPAERPNILCFRKSTSKKINPLGDTVFTFCLHAPFWRAFFYSLVSACLSVSLCLSVCLSFSLRLSVSLLSLCFLINLSDVCGWNWDFLPHDDRQKGTERIYKEKPRTGHRILFSFRHLGSLKRSKHIKSIFGFLSEFPVSISQKNHTENPKSGWCVLTNRLASFLIRDKGPSAISQYVFSITLFSLSAFEEAHSPTAFCANSWSSACLLHVVSMDTASTFALRTLAKGLQ